jgi:predicted aconitase with swiveling domain
MAIDVSARVLIDGAAQGCVLRLSQPISFWGGVDPANGLITQPLHPNFGAEIAGTILALPGMIGSSSSSAIMLELLHNDVAPAALVMAEVDAILGLGVVAAEEIGLNGIPVLQCPIDAFVSGHVATISRGGRIQLGGTG